MYIDDRNYDGFPGWGVIYQSIAGTPDGNRYWEKYNKMSSRGIMNRIGNLFNHKKE
jgi:hypothetical protein